MLIDGRGLVTDHCDKFGDCIVSASLVSSCGQTDRLTNADDRYTHTTAVGVSNNFIY